MGVKAKLATIKAEFKPLSIYQRFERAVVYVLTLLIAIIVVAAIWSLILKILFGLVLSNLDVSHYAPFQSVFGMIFTVIIALEFKKSLLVVAERHDTILQTRSVLMIALLAICRKIIILDLEETNALQVFALAAALLALGLVYRLIPPEEQPA